MRARGRVDEAHGAAVQRGDPAGDGEAEAGAAAGRGAGVGGEGAEPLEHALAVVGGDAGAVVGDLEPPARRGHRARGPGPRRRPGCGGPALSSTLTSSCRSRAGSAGTSRPRSTARRRTGPARGHQLGTTSSTRAPPGPPRRGRARDAGLDAGQVEQVADQVAEPLRPGPPRAPRCSGSAGTTPSARFSSTAVSAGQRGAQLVGDGGDQVALLGGRRWRGRRPSG